MICLLFSLYLVYRCKYSDKLQTFEEMKNDIGEDNLINYTKRKELNPKNYTIHRENAKMGIVLAVFDVTTTTLPDYDLSMGSVHHIEFDDFGPYTTSVWSALVEILDDEEDGMFIFRVYYVFILDI